MKKFDVILKRKIYKRAVSATGVALVAICLFSGSVYAAPTINTLTDTLSSFVKMFGGCVALVGAVTAGLGFRNDDPGEKIKGLRTFIAGLFIIAVGVGASSILITNYQPLPTS